MPLGITTSVLDTNFAKKSYLEATLSVNQTTNMGTGDHVKFDVSKSISGSDISLDATTTYTNSAAVASIGRFTLKAGKTYELEAGLHISTTAGFAYYQWYNATASALIGVGAAVYSSSAGSSTGTNTVSKAVFTPSVDTLVELRITNTSNFSIIYASDGNANVSYALIKTVEAVIPVVSTGYSFISRVSTSSVSIVNTNIVRLQTEETNMGSDIRSVLDGTNGDYYVINRSGIYSFNGWLGSAAGSTTLVIQNGGVPVAAVTPSIEYSASNPANYQTVSWTGYVAAGYITYLWTNGSGYTAGRFSAARVS